MQRGDSLPRDSPRSGAGAARAVIAAAGAKPAAGGLRRLGSTDSRDSRERVSSESPRLRDDEALFGESACKSHCKCYS